MLTKIKVFAYIHWKFTKKKSLFFSNGGPRSWILLCNFICNRILKSPMLYVHQLHLVLLAVLDLSPTAPDLWPSVHMRHFTKSFMHALAVNQFSTDHELSTLLWWRDLPWGKESLWSYWMLGGDGSRHL